MSNMKEAVPAKKPKFLEIADTFYGEAFGPRTPKELARSIADWSEMSPEEQSFALAHLTWLELQAQAGTQRLLVQIRDLLEEVAEGMTEAIDRSDPLDDMPAEVAEVPPPIAAPPAPEGTP